MNNVFFAHQHEKIYRFKLLYLLPRILALGYILFLSLFALDVFIPGKNLIYYAVALFMHLIPNILLTILLIIAWRKEVLGGVLFILAGILFFLYFRNPILINTLLLGPIFIIGLLFLLHKKMARKKIIMLVYEIKLITTSLFNFLILLSKGALFLEAKRIGKTYTIQNHGNYTVFRETVNKTHLNNEEHVLVVGFTLRMINQNTFFHWLFQKVCILTTPFWSGFSGFAVKLWLVDKETKNYLGVYKWQGLQNSKVYCSVLLPILKLVSKKGSVWTQIHSDQLFTSFLLKHQL